MTRKQEREFFRLAAVVLHCRLSQLQKPRNCWFSLLGELDYSSEMALLLQEVR